MDECAVMLQPHFGRGWAVKGQRPTVVESRRHDRITAITALIVSPRRTKMSLVFEFLGHNATREDFFALVVRLFALVVRLKEQFGRLTVVWDRLAAHRGAMTDIQTAGVTGITFELLPPYAPQLNPVAWCWSDLKGVGLKGFAPRSIEPLWERAAAAIDKQASDQRLLRSFFAGAGLNLE